MSSVSQPIDKEKKRLSQQGRCFICLGPGHLIKDCTTAQTKPCCHCGQKGYNNRCLCPVKFSKQETGSALVAAGNKEPSESTTEVRSNEISQQPERPVAVSAGTTPMILAYGEKVLLQTATVPIQGSHGSFSVSAHVLLDSASQRTFMIDSLAKQLGLK